MPAQSGSTSLAKNQARSAGHTIAGGMSLTSVSQVARAESGPCSRAKCRYGRPVSHGPGGTVTSG
ncbi:hypothetical protein [Actinoplanes utahensis]|uniref:hypothetical protein n=1 Tax=Actinoplanes utahensis TaxID=1869 RepID=UPI0019525342|nr:hypothetical protein [Actinoplanes utahensis]